MRMLCTRLNRLGKAPAAYFPQTTEMLAFSMRTTIAPPVYFCLARLFDLAGYTVI